MMDSAYVADVAGHGVAAGVLMSMVKTAVRMHLRTNPQDNKGLLEAVNDTLAPLTDASAYLTFAYLSFEPGKPLTYSLAAHLPIFHLQRRSGIVQRHSIENLPIGMFSDIAYTTATVDLEQGDILAVVTDGLTEVFDSKDRELGDAYISQILSVSAPRPLKEISHDILHFPRNHGKTTDDQTLLLLRRL
jgi:serine phosphatase RsbU (regulator of sigma subunit)